MDNNLLRMNNEKNFVYHEILTDSDNAVKDIARLLALGVESEEILDEAGVIIKPAAPIVDKCWEVVYPKADRVQFPNIEDWNKLLPDEYKEVTGHKINKIKDTVILKTSTLPKNIKTNNSTSMGVNQDLNMKSLTMYLEIYMPPYLCDSEKDDPISQRDGFIPEVIDVNGITETHENTRIARNYHHVFMRIFDNINEDGTGPAQNEVDPVTRDVIKWHSRTSSWSKLSWYTDFEDVFRAPLMGQPELGMLKGAIRSPIISGLTSESKIKLWANINRSRFVLGVMGSPNVDFSDNRYLIGCAYVGQIDSFDFSLNDTAGNFGLFTTSSSSPGMAKTITKTRASVPAVVNPTTNEVTEGNAATATKIAFADNITVLNPGTSLIKTAMELTPIPNEPAYASKWGDRYIDAGTVKIEAEFQGVPRIDRVTYDDIDGVQVVKLINSQMKLKIPCTVEANGRDKKVVDVKVNIDEIIKATCGSEAKNVLTGTNIRFWNANGVTDPKNFVQGKLKMTYTFSYYTEYSEVQPSVTRDKFQNTVKVELDKTYGKNTANGVTDFAMYATFTKDYFQRHFFMFASTEEFMQKELYGKSAYTGEYFADRIKVVHSSEGPRGILSGMITIDTSSLYPFDELIVNKGFEKYDDKPEELFVYLPVTAAYCPFSNSPNGRHGIGILKDIRYPIPVTDEEIVRFAINELDRKYSDLDYVIEDFVLLEESEYGATITWTSNNAPLITVEDPTPVLLRKAVVEAPAQVATYSNNNNNNNKKKGAK